MKKVYILCKAEVGGEEVRMGWERRNVYYFGQVVEGFQTFSWRGGGGGGLISVEA